MVMDVMYIGTVTIKDVAKKAKVSIATVSRVINGADTVNENLRAKVLRAIDELEFVPNSAARSMKIRKNHTVGIIVSDISLPFYANITKQIELECRTKGDIVLFVNTNDDPAAERLGIEFMIQKQADVIVILSTGANEDYMSRLHQRGTSIIFIDRRSKNGDFPSVYVDKRAGMYDAVRFLSEQGHRKIAFISGPEHIITNVDRLRGIQDYFRDAGLKDSDTRCFYGEFTAEYGISVIKSLFGPGSAWQPTAVIAGNAMIASGIFLYCKEHDIAIPDRLSLISFEDFALSQLIEPRLSYVQGEYEEVGNKLIKMINAAMDGILSVSDCVIQPRLMIYDSVKALDGCITG